MRLPSSGETFVATLLLISSLSAFIGVAAPLGSFSHDVFFFLDNAYRVAQGQIPHRDFSSAWGPVIYLIDAAGLSLSGMRPVGVGYANAIFGALIASWAFFVTRSRWSSATACILGIYTLLLITAPFPLGASPFDFGLAMSYNRYGYALFGIILINSTADVLSMEGTDRQSIFWSFFSGVALGSLTFLKISYAIVATLFLVVAMVAGGFNRKRLIALFGGFAILSTFIMCYLRFDSVDMIQDLKMTAVSRHLSLEPTLLLRPFIIIQNAPLIILTGFIYKTQIGLFQKRSVRLRAILVTVLTISLGCLLIISNQQRNSFPLNGYLAAALVAAAAWPSERGKSRRRQSSPLTWLLVLCVLPLFEESILSIGDAVLEREWPMRARVAALAAPERGGNLSFGPVLGTLKMESVGAEYVAAINDGLELIRRRLRSDDGVLTFDMFNPFNYLLNRPSPRGGFAAAAYNYFFCDAVHPDAERFFGDTKYILVRKFKEHASDRVPEDSYVTGLTWIYGSALRARFTEVEETEHWVLWRRK